MGGGASEADIYTYFTTANRQDTFKATGFATPTDITASQTAIIAAVPTAAQNADGLLNRSHDGGSNTGRLVKESFHFIRNQVITTETLGTVYNSDDTTVSWTTDITRSDFDGISGSNPS